MTAKTTAKSTGVLLLGLAFCFGCKGSNKTYTIPTVKNEITKSIRVAMHHRGQGELAKASKEILKTGKKVLKTYPRATLSFKTVKRFLKTSIKIGNLCLDKGYELQQEAVSTKMWKLADVYKARHKTHQKLNTKLRELLPEIQKNEVSAKAKAASASTPGAVTPRPAATTGDATGTTTPATRPTEPTTPTTPATPTTPRDGKKGGDDLPPPEKPTK